MKHLLRKTVYYADTDSYGVVWHGSYLRWMEQGRVEFCREIGLDLLDLLEKDITIPVTNLNIKFKSPAKLDDKIIVETFISKVSPITITFTQIIKSENTDKVFIIAQVEVVAITNSGKLYRRMPEILKDACTKVIEMQEHSGAN